MGMEVDNNRVLFHNNFRIDDLRAIADIDANADNLNSIDRIDVIRRIYLDRAFEFSSAIKEASGMSFFGRAVFWCSRRVYSWGAERVLVRMTKEIVQNYTNGLQRNASQLEERDREFRQRISSAVFEKSKIAGQPSPWLTEEQVTNCVASMNLNKTDLDSKEESLVKDVYTSLADIIKNNLSKRNLPVEIFGKVYRKLGEEPSGLLDVDAWGRFNTLANDVLAKRNTLIAVLPGINDEEKAAAADAIIQGAIAQNERSVEDVLSLAVKGRVNERFLSKLQPVIIPAQFDDATRRNAEARIAALRALKSVNLENQLNRMEDVVAETNQATIQLLNTLTQEHHAERCKKETKRIREAYTTLLDVLPQHMKADYEEKFEKAKGKLEQLSPSNQELITDTLKVMENLLVVVIEKEFNILNQIRNCYNNALNSTLDAIAAFWGLEFRPITQEIKETRKVPELQFSLNSLLVSTGKEKENLHEKVSTKFTKIQEKINSDTDAYKSDDLKKKEAVRGLVKQYLSGASESFTNNFNTFNPNLDLRVLYNDAVKARNAVVDIVLGTSKDRVSNGFREYMKALSEKTLREIDQYQAQFSKKMGELSGSIHCDLSIYNNPLKKFDSQIQEVQRLLGKAKEFRSEISRANGSDVEIRLAV